MNRRLRSRAATARFALLLAAGASAMIATPGHAQSLDAVIAATLEQSPELAAARAREAGANARLDAARAERMPSATVQGQVATGRIDPQGFFGLAADNVTPRSIQFGTELPLFTGGRIGAAEAEARAGIDAARAGAEAMALELRVQVVRAYAGAIAAHQQATTQARMIATLEAALRDTRLRFRAGDGTSTEVAQAEARLAEARAGLSAAEGAETEARAMLRALSGMEVTPDAGLPVPAQPAMTPQAAVALAIAHNPRIRAAERLLAAARAGLDGARAARMPVVGAYAEAGSVRDQFFPGYKADTASVGIRARWTLFDGGRTGARVRGAQAEMAEREARLRAERAEIERRTIAAHAALVSARATYDAASARAEAAAAALRGTRLEVQTGAKPMLALLDAEREAGAAEGAKTTAAADMQVQAQLLAALTGS